MRSIVLPLLLMLVLVAIGVTTAVLPVDAGSRSCGSALAIERGGSLPHGFDDTEQKDCHDKAHASVEVGALTLALALVGSAGSAVAVRTTG